MSGEYVGDKKHGKGVYTFADGEELAGLWKEDQVRDKGGDLNSVVAAIWGYFTFASACDTPKPICMCPSHPSHPSHPFHSNDR